MSSPPYRVLLAENTIRGLGGSYESLFVTATALDRTRFEPIVLFFQQNHFVAKLRDRGIRVLIETSHQFWEREEYLEKASPVRARLPRRGILGGLRRKLVAFLRAIVGGLPMGWTVYRTLRRERIDLLHTNNNLQRDAMMILAACAAGVPVVAHERQLAVCSLFTRLLSKRVRVLVCISDAVLEFTRSSGARTRDRRRIHNAIDTSSTGAVRPALEPGPKRVGIVGRILPKKGQKYFILAARRVREAVPSTEFYVIGQSTGENKAYEEEVRELARNSGLESRVHWTGHVDGPLGLMASLDVIVHAAIEPEPFGRVIIEAMALGRPIVATALGGPVEILRDGESGFLVPPADPDAIADRVVLLLRDEGVARQMGEAARSRSHDFGVDNYIRQIMMAYDDALIASGHGVKP